MRVLLVEDEATLRGLLQQVLEEEGHEVMAADCVSAALEYAARSSFDYALCDEGLPDGSGRKLLGTLRSTHGAGLRTLLMTGDLFQVDSVEQPVLVKPFRFGLLLDHLAASPLEVGSP